MTSKIIAIQANHLSDINFRSDTTVFLANEAQKKNYSIFYYHPKKLLVKNNKVTAKGFFVRFNYNEKKNYKILKKSELDLSKCKFLLIRQDPPFNLEYISSTFILDLINEKVKIINNPSSIRNISEKFYSTRYLKFMPETIFTQDIGEIKKFFKHHKKIILKPIHGYSGNDIHLIKKFELRFIKNFIKKNNFIMCQKFLPKIINGDKRVFLINGKICGAISRIPKKGSFLSNLSKGAKPSTTKLTKKEERISKIIAKDMKKEKVFFCGIDFIDQKINGDINVTSPTGLKTFYDLTKINLAKTFWKALKA